MLQQHHEALWTMAVPFRLLGCNLGLRMTVVRLPDGKLWVHSPVRLDAAGLAELKALGEVAFVVAPNRMHHRFVKPFLEEFPRARLLVAPGLTAKRPDLSGAVPLSVASQDSWRRDIDVKFVEGVPTLEEFVFFHEPSRSLLVTDLAFNLQRLRGPWETIFGRLNGCYRRFGPSRLLRMSVRSRARFRASLDRIAAWNFDRIVVCHGDLVDAGGKARFREAF